MAAIQRRPRRRSKAAMEYFIVEPAAPKYLTVEAALIAAVPVLAALIAAAEPDTSTLCGHVPTPRGMTA